MVTRPCQEFYVQLRASEKNIAINENYNARAVKDCEREKTTVLSRKNKDPNQLIVVRDANSLSLLGIPNYTAYVLSYPDLLDTYQSTMKESLTIEEYGYSHWKRWGNTEVRVMPRLPPIVLSSNQDYLDYF